MKDVSINGVGFNADAISSMSEEDFKSHEMHANHWPHLTEDKKKKQINDAWETLSKINGTDKRNDGSPAKSEGKPSRNSRK